MLRRNGVKTKVTFLLVLSVMICSLSGCSVEEQTKTKKNELTTTGFAFNTTYTISLYKGGSKKLLNKCIKKCAEFENVFSRTLADSELSYINEIEESYLKVVNSNEKIKAKWENGKVRYSKKQIKWITGRIKKKISEKNDISFVIKKNGYIEIKVSELISDITQKGLSYSELTKGAFDITIEPVSSLWNFSSDKPKVPQKDKIASALRYINYKKVKIDGMKLTFMQPGMGLDFGGIAKGFIADRLKVFLTDNGVTSGMINLGGNILCIGKKTDGKPFNIGIQQPFADRNETIAAVHSDDTSIVSSGIYERYFKTKSGKLYHHILNPKTGYSYNNGLIAVTIVSDKSVDGDGLSTSCFALGLKKGMKLINETENVEAVFITADEKLHYSENFEKLM